MNTLFDYLPSGQWLCPMFPFAIEISAMRPVSESFRRVQTSGRRRTLGARRLRHLDSRGALRQHRLSRADLQHQSNTDGTLAFHLLHLQTEKRRRMHSMCHSIVLHIVSRDVRTASGSLHGNR